MKNQHCNGPSKNTDSILENVFNQDIRLDFNGNKEVIIEGGTGILEYTEHTVRINTRQYILALEGNNMEIKTMNQEYMIVSGCITKLEFLL